MIGCRKRLNWQRNKAYLKGDAQPWVFPFENLRVWAISFAGRGGLLDWVKRQGRRLIGKVGQI